MPACAAWESFKHEGGEHLERVKEIVAQGNARGVGLVGVLLAPVRAVAPALAAVLLTCAIEVEHVVPEDRSKGMAGRARK